MARPFNPGDKVILKPGFNGKRTVHIVKSITPSRCQGGWLVHVSPDVLGSSGHGLSCNWFDLVADEKTPIDANQIGD